MGAYGAALYAMTKPGGGLLDAEALDHFTHTATPSICKGCANHCHLTINHFADGERYISGNQCQRALGVRAAEELPNLYAWKRDYLASLKPQEGRRGIIGLPLALSTYELAPLWHATAHGAGLRGAIFGPVQPREPTSGASSQHPLRHGVLSREARCTATCDGAAGARASPIRCSIPTLTMQRRRWAHGQQPLQLPRGGLLRRDRSGATWRTRCKGERFLHIRYLRLRWPAAR